MTINELVQLLSDGGVTAVALYIAFLMRKDVKELANSITEQLKGLREDWNKRESDRLQSEQQMSNRLIELITSSKENP